MSGVQFTMLRTYAERVDPNTLPPTIKLCATDFSVTIFDIFPKSLFHFLLLPFIRPPRTTVAGLRDLRSLLQLPREEAQGLLLNIRRDALEAKVLIEEEMVRRHGFKWGIQMGFHAVPSIQYVPLELRHIQHIHLHIMSTELCGEYMRSKKHMNSFHPKLGFFLHLDDVLSWFEPDVAPSWFKMKTNFNKKEYEALLKEDLTCPGHCDEPFKIMRKLKDHLLDVHEARTAQYEKEMEAAAANYTAYVAPQAENDPHTDDAVVVAGTKRKHGDSSNAPSESRDAESPVEDSHPAKRQATTSESEHMQQEDSS